MAPAERIWGTLRGDRNPLAVILGLSLATEAAWFTTQNVGFLGDSPSYVQYAWGLLGVSVPSTILATRPPGYPLLLVLTGAVGPDGAFYSFFGILLVQAAMAVIMPLFAFKALEPYDRRTAFFTALVMIVSFEPYITSKLVMTEQSYKLLTVLLAYFICRAFTTIEPRWSTLGVSVISVLLVMLRPGALLIPLMVFTGLWIARPGFRMTFLGGAVAVLAFMFCYSLVTSTMLAPKGLFRLGIEAELPHFAVHVPTLAAFADLAFYDLYMHDGAAALDPSKGPARRALRNVVEAFAYERPQDWVNREPPSYYGAYAGAPEAWVKALYRNPNPYYYGALKDAVVMMGLFALDPVIRAETDHLIPRVLIEAYAREPRRLISFLARYGTAALTGYTGQLLFYKVFVLDRLATLSPQNGPATREFIGLLRTYLNGNPEEVRRITPPSMRAGHPATADAFIQSHVIGQPDGSVFFNVWQIIDQMKGPLAARELYVEVAREGLANGLVHGASRGYQDFAWSGVNNLLEFFFGVRGIKFEYFYNVIQSYREAQWEEELLQGDRLTTWPAVRRDADTIEPKWWLDDVIRDVWFGVRLACNLLIGIGAAFCTRTRYRYPFLVIGGIIVYDAATACFLVAPDVRYMDQILPMTTVLAGLIVTCAVEAIRGGRAAGYELS